MKLLKELIEASKTKTQTKDKVDIKQDWSAKQDSPLTKAEPKKDSKKTTKSQDDIEAVSKDKTRTSMRATDPETSARMAQHMADLVNLDGEDPYPDMDQDNDTPTDDTFGNDTPTEPATLPALQTKTDDIAVIGQKYKVDFHSVKNLPGMIQRGVRILGNAIFKNYTQTALGDIMVVSTFTNSPRDVNNVAGYADQNADIKIDIDFDFAQVMPGYTAQARMVDTGQYTYFIVKDFGGQYVYVWPSKDNFKRIDHVKESRVTLFKTMKQLFEGKYENSEQGAIDLIKNDSIFTGTNDIVYYAVKDPSIRAVWMVYALDKDEKKIAANIVYIDESDFEDAHLTKSMKHMPSDLKNELQALNMWPVSAEMEWF